MTKRETQQYVKEFYPEIAKEVLNGAPKILVAKKFGISAGAVDSALWLAGHKAMVSPSYRARKEKAPVKRPQATGKADFWKQLLDSGHMPEAVMEAVVWLIEETSKSKDKDAIIASQKEELRQRGRELEEARKETKIARKCMNDALAQRAQSAMVSFSEK